MSPLFAVTLAVLLAQEAPSGTGRSAAAGEARGVPAARLQAAVDGARAGDTIRAGAGTYTGTLAVRVPLVIIGEPGSVLEGAGGDVVQIAADSVVLRGFTIRRGGRSLDEDGSAVKVMHCSGCVIAGNRIERSLHGIYLLESRGTEVSGNVIEGDGSLAEAKRGNGIHLFHSSGNRIEGNVIRGTRDGVYFSFASHNTVVDNEVTGVRYGLHYMYSDDNVFRNNRFTRSAAGAAIMYSSRIVLESNVFAEHVGYRAYGLLLQTAYEVEVVGNRIAGNLVGVFLDMAENNTFRGNEIVGNGTGIDLIPSAEGNTFVENVIVGNRVAVRVTEGGGANRWAVQGRGNYWGERGVFDLNGDGIGDRPHRAGDPFASLAATRPVLELLAGTPAARALAWAERAFPVFDLPEVEDPSPLVRPPAALAARNRGGSR